MRTVAIMQPYLFPYIGYFQLLHCCDVFTFMDDVRWIKNGWINRNKIWGRDKEVWLTVPVNKIRSTDRIFDVKLANSNYKVDLTNKLKEAYWDAPNLELVLDLINELPQTNSAMELAESSLAKIAYVYLGLNRSILSSSGITTLEANREARLIDLCKQLNGTNYINMEGGKELYTKEAFAQKGVDLKFLCPKTPSYRNDNSGKPVPGNLSILDALAYLDIGDIQRRIADYALE